MQRGLARDSKGHGIPVALMVRSQQQSLTERSVLLVARYTTADI